jgi:hypothetical protein
MQLSTRTGRRIAPLILAILASTAAWSQTTAAPAVSPTGAITGTVQTADGKPVAKVPVAIRVRPATRGAKPTIFNADVTTGADGTFSVKNVPDGLYAVCPFPTSGSLLPPCNWEAEPTATVSGGKTTAMKPLALKQGVDLWVRVDDPNGTRASKEGKVPGVGLVLVVRAANGAQVHIPQTKSDSTGADHHVYVPAGVDLSVIGVSLGFQISSNSAKAQAAVVGGSPNVMMPVNIPTGATQHQETITVF